MTRRDDLYIGMSPFGEDCAQVGEPGYYERAKVECRVFADQLKRTFPKGTFTVIGHSHDFGTYLAVHAEFDAENYPEAEMRVDSFCEQIGDWTDATVERALARMTPEMRAIYEEGHAAFCADMDGVEFWDDISLGLLKLSGYPVASLRGADD